MEIIALTKQLCRNIKKNLSHQKFHGEKRHLPVNLVFLKIWLHLQLWAKSHHAQLFWCKTVFQFNYPKANDPSNSEHVNFDQYHFKSRNDFHVNLVPTEPKNDHFTYFLKDNTTFTRWKTENLQPRPSGSWVRCGHFELKAGDPI